jgi:hypothetical protein
MFERLEADVPAGASVRWPLGEFELDSTLPHRLSLLYGGHGEKTHLLQARAGDDRRCL